MKRVILTLMFALATFAIASAQKYCIVDSEKIFKSLDEYNKAMETLDELGKAYQTEIDNKATCFNVEHRRWRQVLC